MVNWKFYPQSEKPFALVLDIVKVFNDALPQINSGTYSLKSNEVLAKVTNSLENLGFEVEKGKKKYEKILIPVLFGLNGQLEKSFDADAYNEQQRFIIEVEAGRGVANHQFLKDLFQACMMYDVDYLAIAVRNRYRNKKDFEEVLKFFDTLYASNRLKLPLKGVLIIGY